VTQAEQVKYKVIEKVTGLVRVTHPDGQSTWEPSASARSTVTGQAVVPSIQAETGGGEVVYRGTPAIRYYAEDTSAPEPFVPKPDAQSAPSRALDTEALDAFRLGFANVYVYRAFKELEARVAKLEGER
jgi:hypothetical protein